MAKRNTVTQYAEALYELTCNLKGEKMHSAVAEFVKLLACEHKLKQGERITEEFIKYAKKMEGVVPLTVITAREMTEKELIKIGNVFSKNAEVTAEVDPSLVGGVVIKTDDVIFDASLRTQVTRLKNSLI